MLMIMTMGMDIASWQGFPDFIQLYKEGVRFVITKVTGEMSYVNPNWKLNRDRARAAKMIVGYYDWVEPQNAMHADQYTAGVLAARDFLNVLAARQPTDLLCVDFESKEWFTGPFGRDIEQFMKSYLYTLKNEGGTRAVIIYTAKYFLDETGATNWTWLGKDFILWQAAPGSATGTDSMLRDDSFWPASPAPFSETWLHQHQWFARSVAVIGNFDRNRFKGTAEELAYLGVPGELPNDNTNLGKAGDEVPEELLPEDGKTTAIEWKGKPYLIWNAGGEVKPGGIKGYNIQDMGMSVESATEPGKLLDRSIQNNTVQIWHERDEMTQKIAEGLQ